jgi:hypothetical protein
LETSGCERAGGVGGVGNGFEVLVWCVGVGAERIGELRGFNRFGSIRVIERFGRLGRIGVGVVERMGEELGVELEVGDRNWCWGVVVGIGLSWNGVCVEIGD